jgi:hypothetical protein
MTPYMENSHDPKNPVILTEGKNPCAERTATESTHFRGMSFWP